MSGPTTEGGQRPDIDCDDHALAVAAGRKAREGEAYLVAGGAVTIVADPATAEERAAMVAEGQRVPVVGWWLRQRPRLRVVAVEGLTQLFIAVDAS